MAHVVLLNASTWIRARVTILPQPKAVPPNPSQTAPNEFHDSSHTDLPTSKARIVANRFICDALRGLESRACTLPLRRRRMRSTPVPSSRALYFRRAHAEQGWEFEPARARSPHSPHPSNPRQPGDCSEPSHGSQRTHWTQTILRPRRSDCSPPSDRSEPSDCSQPISSSHKALERSVCGAGPSRRSHRPPAQKRKASAAVAPRPNALDEPVGSRGRVVVQRRTRSPAVG